MPIGSNFDDFLNEEGLYEQTTAAALKKVLALQIEEGMKTQQLTKNCHGKAYAHQPSGAQSLAG